MLHQAGIMPNDWTPSSAPRTAQQETDLPMDPMKALQRTGSYRDDYKPSGSEREWLLHQSGIMPNDWVPTKERPTELQQRPSIAPYREDYKPNGSEREWLLHQAGIMPNDWTPTKATKPSETPLVDNGLFRPKPGTVGPTRSDLTSSGLSPVAAELHTLATALNNRQVEWEAAFAPYDEGRTGVVSVSALLRIFRSVDLSPEPSLFRSLPSTVLAPNGVRYASLVQLFC